MVTLLITLFRLSIQGLVIVGDLGTLGCRRLP